jgi:hypothetical protein
MLTSADTPTATEHTKSRRGQPTIRVLIDFTLRNFPSLTEHLRLM